MTFENLLEQLSARLGVELEDAGGAAAIEVDGTPIVLQDAGELLLLRADLGAPPPEDPATLHRAALEANFLYRGTRGATLALDPDSGHLHLQSYNWLERLDAEKAADMLFRFEDAVADWKELVAAYRAPAAHGVPDADPDVAPQIAGFMQV